MCLRFVYLLVVSGFSWLRLAARGRGLEGHGTPSGTPPAPRAPTAAGTQTTIDAGRPGADRCAGTCDPQGAAGGIAAGGDSRHGDALASRLAAPPVGQQVPRGMLRSPCHPTRHPSRGSPAGQGEPGLGIPENPRRTRRHGHPDRLCHSNIRLGVVTCGFAAGCRSD
jgi:hypothetical protein